MSSSNPLRLYAHLEPRSDGSFDNNQFLDEDDSEEGAIEYEEDEGLPSEVTKDLKIVERSGWTCFVQENQEQCVGKQKLDEDDQQSECSTIRPELQIEPHKHSAIKGPSPECHEAPARVQQQGKSPNHLAIQISAKRHSPSKRLISSSEHEGKELLARGTQYTAEQKDYLNRLFREKLQYPKHTFGDIIESFRTVYGNNPPRTESGLAHLMRKMRDAGELTGDEIPDYSS